MAKKQTTDLPGADLLFGPHIERKEDIDDEVVDRKPVKEAEKEVPKSIKRPIAASVDSGEVLPIKFAPLDDEEYVKFTFYFPPKLLEDLEVAKFRLRMERRVKTSKSEIVNMALSYVLKDINFLERLVRGKLE